jgi:hypothetical protein
MDDGVSIPVIADRLTGVLTFPDVGDGLPSGGRSLVRIICQGDAAPLPRKPDPQGCFRIAAAGEK